LEVFGYREDKVINDDDLVNILKIIESYAFRRLICNVPTNALNKVFAILGRDIKKHPEFKENYFEIFKFILINKRHSQRLPSDEEFSEMLGIRDIYNLKSKNKLHLLERLENYDNVEKVSVEELLNEGQLNIEHIMPRTLSVRWKETLGENWEEVHNKYLNTLGNITLTGYNTKMSNRPFLEKRDMEKGFKDSKLSLNKHLWNLHTWNENRIIERADKLKSIALKIWTYPITNYIGREREYNQFNLSEDYNFTGEKMKSFTLMGQEYPVKSWKEFYSVLSQNLYDLDPDIFTNFLSDKDFMYGKKLISENMDDLRSPIKISENIYLESNLSAESIVNNVRLMLRKYDIDEDEVSVYLAEKDGKDLSDTQKKRIEFWDGTRHFENNRSHKYYDLFCSSGVPGFGYYYAIKQKTASIGLGINTGSKDKNDFIFRKLLEKKNEIENKFGEELGWFNDKNIKSSAVHKEYNFAGLQNEDQWLSLQNDMVDGMVKLTVIFDEYIKDFG